MKKLWGDCGDWRLFVFWKNHIRSDPSPGFWELRT